MTKETYLISKLISDPANARKHEKKNLEAIKGSLKRFGQQKPIVISDDGVVIAGNGTLKAAQELGWQEIWVAVSKLKGSDRTAFAIADNRAAELAEWETDILSKTLQALKDEDFDLGEIGFDDKDLANFLEPKVFEGQCDDDALPENVETRTKLGDLYQLGEHRLLCGDSTDVLLLEKLMASKKADMVFTDPPYGVSFVGLKGTMYSDGKKKGKDSAEEIKGDDLRDQDLTDLFRNSLYVALSHCADTAPLYIFFGINRSIETLTALQEIDLTIRNWLIWDKGNVGHHAMGAQYKPNFEAFLYCHKKGFSPYFSGSHTEQTIWRYTSERLGLHPTMKPVALIEKAFENHNTVGIVLDPFLGSGSTLIAAEKTGRKCFGMELDPHYCDVIVSRWEKFTGKKAVMVNSESVL